MRSRYLVQGRSTKFAAFITITSPIFCVATPVAGGYSIVVPAVVNGQSYAVLMGRNKVVSDDTIAVRRGPAIVEVTNL
jgi:hypothetical protein